jgi:prophage regulatory protein
MPATERFLRRPAVREITGLPDSSIYALMARGEFPENFRLSENRVAWRESDVRAWQADRLKAAEALRSKPRRKARKSR